MPAEEILATANKKLDEAKELVKKKRKRYRVQNYDYDARDWSTISAHKDEDYAIINAEILARRYRTIRIIQGNSTTHLWKSGKVAERCDAEKVLTNSESGEKRERCKKRTLLHNLLIAMNVFFNYVQQKKRRWILYLNIRFGKNNMKELWGKWFRKGG